MNSRPKLLIFIVAYNAERHIEKVLDRIPKSSLVKYDYEILIIDDQSKDATFDRAMDWQKKHPDLHLTVLFNPENQGYGGNQKLGYHYAQIHQFDVVLLLHGDGQYAPEEFEKLILPIIDGNADAVFGSRMLNKRDAIKGKMPYYKFIGNIILTKLQNYILHTQLSEFHSGYRAYRVKALSNIPFERNSNEFHFDTQIIIQLVLAKMKIEEVPIPTHYGDEICYVNGPIYAYNILKASIHSRLQRWGIYYKREYDLDQNKNIYNLKSGYPSSHSVILDAIKPGTKIAEIGPGHGLLSGELIKQGCHVTGINLSETPSPKEFTEYIQCHLPDYSDLPAMDEYDAILLMDIVESLDHPEILLDTLREQVKLSEPDIYLSVANVGFFITRFQLLFGGFNYGRRGILDLNHKRLFTGKSIRRLCDQSGMNVEKIIPIPAPLPEAFGLNAWTRFLIRCNKAMIFISKGLFSYEYVLKIKARPVVKHIIKHTLTASGIKSDLHHGTGISK
jgi:glycosyltransferase involved in cell wall biosynthesis